MQHCCFSSTVGNVHKGSRSGRLWLVAYYKKHSFEAKMVRLPEPAARSGGSLRLLVTARRSPCCSPAAPSRRGSWRWARRRACGWCPGAPPSTAIPAQGLQFSVCSIMPIGGAIVLGGCWGRRGRLGAALLCRGRSFFSLPQSLVQASLHCTERTISFSPPYFSQTTNQGWTKSKAPSNK